MVLKEIHSKHNDNLLPMKKNVHLKSSDQKVHLVSAAAKIGKFSWPDAGLLYVVKMSGCTSMML